VEKRTTPTPDPGDLLGDICDGVNASLYLVVDADVEDPDPLVDAAVEYDDPGDQLETCTFETGAPRLRAAPDPGDQLETCTFETGAPRLRAAPTGSEIEAGVPGNAENVGIVGPRAEKVCESPLRTGKVWDPGVFTEHV